jgi:transposase
MLESNSGAPADAMDGTARIALLESELELLRRRDAERTAELAARERRIRLLEEALRILQADRYGSSREKLHVAPGQTELFNEAETLVELNEALGAEVNLKATPQREEKSNPATKAGRKAIAAHLPRVPIVYDIPQSERQCACGTILTEIGSEVTEQLDYMPPKIQVLQHVRKKYACPGCEQCIKTAPLPAQILRRTNAAPGLLAHLVASKYVDALPLYRQEAIFARYGVQLPRATQAAWIIALAERVQPLINLMDERLRGSGYIRIDETPLQVINSEKAATAEHWMWVRVAGPPRQWIILFDYDPSRGHEVAERLLEGVHGILQSDGHRAYDQVAGKYGLIHCGCIAHARRKFFDAIKALPKDAQKNPTAAHEAVRRIDELYKIERDISTFSDAEHRAVRQERAVPLLDRCMRGRAACCSRRCHPESSARPSRTFCGNGPSLFVTPITARSPSTPTLPRTPSDPSPWGGATGCSPIRSVAPRPVPIFTAWCKPREPTNSSRIRICAACSRSYRPRKVSRTSRPCYRSGRQARRTGGWQENRAKARGAHHR